MNGVLMARELITWRLAEGDDEGPKIVARESAALIHDPMLLVDTVMALVEALAATFGDIESWREHIVDADLGEDPSR